MIRKIFIIMFLIFNFALSSFAVSEQEVNQHIKSLERTIILDNGITFDIKPSVENNKLYISLAISNGWIRLNKDECYDVHLINADNIDIADIAFYSDDFDLDKNYSTKDLDVENFYDDLMQGIKFKMRYPAWIEDK